MIGEPLHVSHMDTAMFYNDVAFLPEWPSVPFGDEEGQIISDAIGDKNAILLAHHGQMCAAPSVEAACVMGVFFEHAARIQLLAKGAGEIKDIDARLGKEAHDWRHKPEAMATTFHYFARMALLKHRGAVLN
jgi:L-fuculose-phosphate aldolase